MNLFLITIVGLLAVAFNGIDGCEKKRKATDDITGVSMTYHIPYVHEAGSETALDNTYLVYHNGDINLYRFCYQYDSVSDDVPVLQETRYRYFVHHKDSASGFLFDPKGWVPEMRIPVDSMNKFRFENPQWDTIARMTIDSSFRMENRDVVQVYQLKPSEKYPGSHTYYFYYTDRLKGIRESFSKMLETIHRKKLYKIRMVTHPFYYEPYNRMVQEMEAYYEMKDIIVENREEVKEYFEKYIQRTSK